ncbi:hypothetical protein [Streptomyces sp. NPDC059566]|uniref:hypothetical protein n=1 Tax=Streptomyces sp. NPDC059566 TaxID=3346866 RepID=UPI00367B978C
MLLLVPAEGRRNFVGEHAAAGVVLAKVAEQLQKAFDPLESRDLFSVPDGVDQCDTEERFSWSSVH